MGHIRRSRLALTHRSRRNRHVILAATMKPQRPDDIPSDWRYCSDCNKEQSGCNKEQSGLAFTRDGWQPPENFYSGTRSYCKYHQALRNNACRRARMERLTHSPNPADTALLEALLETKRQADSVRMQREWADPTTRKKREAINNKWRKKPGSKEKVAAGYARWAKENPDTRRASQQAYRDRQNMRSSGYRFKVDHAPRDEYKD